ncbi:uncharacterized protein LOC135812433 isoform X1 [Sycon ciliatum]|uniref:uncharacterized protein LOC135812432 isoform X1 n=1 Tax=Sycon ciliatum TaxID=27933 RepID=UPI0031F6FB0C
MLYVHKPDDDDDDDDDDECCLCNYLYTCIIQLLCVCVCTCSCLLLSGPDAISTLFEALAEEEEEERIKDDLVERDMIITEQQQGEFRNASECWACHRPLGDDRVRDHDHIMGLYRGAAHASCNLKMRIVRDTQIIPVIFHNLKGYDAHLLISSIGLTAIETERYVDRTGRTRAFKKGKIGVIPNNMERYVSFTWGHFRFIDSLAFLNTSLEKLVSNTPRDSFAHLSSLVARHATRMNSSSSNEELFDLLRRKGVYPYEYMDDFTCTPESPRSSQRLSPGSRVREHRGGFALTLPARFPRTDPGQRFRSGETRTASDAKA